MNTLPPDFVSTVVGLPLAWQLFGARPLDGNCIILPAGEFTDVEVSHIRQSFPDAIVFNPHVMTLPTPPELLIPDRLDSATH